MKNHRKPLQDTQNSEKNPTKKPKHSKNQQQKHPNNTKNHKTSQKITEKKLKYKKADSKNPISLSPASSGCFVPCSRWALTLYRRPPRGERWGGWASPSLDEENDGVVVLGRCKMWCLCVCVLVGGWKAYLWGCSFLLGLLKQLYVFSSWGGNNWRVVGWHCEYWCFCLMLSWYWINASD